MFGLFEHCYSSLKKSGLVLGIGGVLFLQLAFTTLISSSEFFERSSAIVRNADVFVRPLPLRPNDIAVVSDPEATLAEIVRLPKKSASQAKRPEALAVNGERKGPRRELSAKVPVYKGRLMPQAKVPGDRVEMHPKWKAENNNFAAASYTLGFAEEGRNTKRPGEKRSFFAKAVPIIKKPYNVIKAVGARIF